MEVKAIKCPSCGANVEYDGSKPFLHCQYCGTEIAVETDTPSSESDDVQTVHIVDDAKMKRLEMREQRHQERRERHEKRHEERRERREERHERRLRGFI